MLIFGEAGGSLWLMKQRYMRGRLFCENRGEGKKRTTYLNVILFPVVYAYINTYLRCTLYNHICVALNMYTSLIVDFLNAYFITCLLLFIQTSLHVFFIMWIQIHLHNSLHAYFITCILNYMHTSFHENFITCNFHSVHTS